MQPAQAMIVQVCQIGVANMDQLFVAHSLLTTRLACPASGEFVE